MEINPGNEFTRQEQVCADRITEILQSEETARQRAHELSNKTRVFLTDVAADINKELKDKLETLANRQPNDRKSHSREYDMQFKQKALDAADEIPGLETVRTVQFSREHDLDMGGSYDTISTMKALKIEGVVAIETTVRDVGYTHSRGEFDTESQDVTFFGANLDYPLSGRGGFTAGGADGDVILSVAHTDIDTWRSVADAAQAIANKALADDVATTCKLILDDAGIQPTVKDMLSGHKTRRLFRNDQAGDKWGLIEHPSTEHGLYGYYRVGKYVTEQMTSGAPIGYLRGVTLDLATGSYDGRLELQGSQEALRDVFLGNLRMVETLFHQTDSNTQETTT